MGWGSPQPGDGAVGQAPSALRAARVPSLLSPLLPLTPRILDNNRIARITPATFSGLRSLYFL